MVRMAIVAFLIVFSFDLNAEPLKLTEVVVAEDHLQVNLSGGNSSGIGGDTVDQRYLSAWFYGTKEIKTCFSSTTNFGVAEAELVAEIKAAIARWQAYFDKKKIESKVDAEMINSNFVFTGKCIEEEDLRLYFGTGPIFGNLSDLKVAQTLGSPVAYINKTHLADDMLWSRGYIRFISSGYYAAGPEPFPNWSIKGTLATMITHEMGHVLGFVHVPFTIMASDIAEKLFFDKSSNSSPIIDIDSPRELVTCQTCAFDLKSIESAKVDAEAVSALGIIPASGLSLIGDREHGLRLKNGSKFLTISVDTTSTIESTPALISNAKNRPIYGQVISLQYGTIKDPSGAQYPIIIEKNISTSAEGGRVAIRVFHQQTFKLLCILGGSEK